MMDNVPDHIFFKDRQSRFILNSRSQAEMMGLDDPAQTVGKTDFDFFPHAQQAFEKNRRSSIPPGRSWTLRNTWSGPTAVRRGFQPPRFLCASRAARSSGCLASPADITDRKHAEESLRESQSAAGNPPTGNWNHFRTPSRTTYARPCAPLTDIRACLLEDYESLLDAEGKRLFNVVRSEAQRMGQLIDDLLAFSRLGRAEMPIYLYGYAQHGRNDFQRTDHTRKPEHGLTSSWGLFRVPGATHR
jgi:PAS domain-containing protein